MKDTFWYTKGQWRQPLSSTDTLLLGCNQNSMTNRMTTNDWRDCKHDSTVPTRKMEITQTRSCLFFLRETKSRKKDAWQTQVLCKSYFHVCSQPRHVSPTETHAVPPLPLFTQKRYDFLTPRVRPHNRATAAPLIPRPLIHAKLTIVAPNAPNRPPQRIMCFPSAAPPASAALPPCRSNNHQFSPSPRLWVVLF